MRCRKWAKRLGPPRPVRADPPLLGSRGIWGGVPAGRPQRRRVPTLWDDLLHIVVPSKRRSPLQRWGNVPHLLSLSTCAFIRAGSPGLWPLSLGAPGGHAAPRRPRCRLEKKPVGLTLPNRDLWVSVGPCPGVWQHAAILLLLLGSHRRLTAPASSPMP